MRLGLDPYRGALVVERAIILVLAECPLPLHQSEPAGTVVDVAVDPERGRVHQRTPQPLAVSRADLQTVRIVNLRPPVDIDAPVILADQVHAGACRDADPVNLLARIQRRIHIHDERVGRFDHEAIGSGDARGVKQPVHRQLVGVLLRPLQVEGDELGKFLRVRHARIHGEPALGNAVLQIPVDGAKVRGALEDRHVARPVGMKIHAKAGVPEVFGHVLGFKPALAVIEHVAVEAQLLDLAIFHDEHAHRLLGGEAKMEEPHLEAQVIIRPQ